MLKLTASERFVSEYRRYKNSIDKIHNDAAKQRALSLLSKLKEECAVIDEAHSPRNSKNIDPRTARENIKKTVEIRQQLDQLIRDAR